ncbi:uncharacterized protein BN677_00947 [Prevotella sp. CAG:485]|nr:uncharacterized protein BN677_00947 [Prevotella sp. CAG:485]
MAAHPGNPLLRIAAITLGLRRLHHRAEESPVRRQQLILHTRVQHILLVQRFPPSRGLRRQAETVVEHLATHIAPILLAQRFQQVEGHGPLLRLQRVEPGLNHGVVAARGRYHRGVTHHRQPQPLRRRVSLLRRGKRGCVGIADTVFAHHAAVVESPLLRRGLRQRGRRRRWHQVELQRRPRAFRVLQRHRQRAARRGLAHAKVGAVGSKDYHVAAACAQRGVTLTVARAHRHRVIFRVVVDAERHTRILHRLARDIRSLHRGQRRGSVVGRNIYSGVMPVSVHDLLRAVVVAAEHIRVHHHAPTCRLIEPGKVENRLRLAGAQEVPFAVGPGFHPGVIVVGMRPARRVDLTRRYAHAAQRRHSKRRLLAAAPYGLAHTRQRRRGPRVRRPVRYLFVAPVVDLQDGLLHAQTLHTLFQLGVEHRPAHVEVLVVGAHRQHKVIPLAQRHRRAPWHLRARTQRRLHILPPERRVIHGPVRLRHVAV